MRRCAAHVTAAGADAAELVWLAVWAVGWIAAICAVRDVAGSTRHLVDRPWCPRRGRRSRRGDRIDGHRHRAGRAEPPRWRSAPARRRIGAGVAGVDDEACRRERRRRRRCSAVAFARGVCLACRSSSRSWSQPRERQARERRRRRRSLSADLMIVPPVLGPTGGWRACGAGVNRIGVAKRIHIARRRRHAGSEDGCAGGLVRGAGAGG